MLRYGAKLIVSAVFGISLLSGCIESRAPIRQVQFCVANDEGLEALKTLLHDIARSQRMEYADASAKTEEEFEAVEEVLETYQYSEPVTRLGVQRDDHVGLTASNVDPNSFQITVSFSAGADALAAQEFAETVISALEQQWVVQEVASGQRARPSDNCPRSN